ncbi:MAG TPA: hypothetical protein PLB34_05870 [Rhodoblastus sp.]|nr:hypothetical protein [Rhodoblastus sp.]
MQQRLRSMPALRSHRGGVEQGADEVRHGLEAGKEHGEALVLGQFEGVAGLDGRDVAGDVVRIERRHDGPVRAQEKSPTRVRRASGIGAGKPV